MSYKLFLDDKRDPENCVSYMHLHIGTRNPIYLEEWKVVRNFKDFRGAVIYKGLPEVVSFDHDLSMEHYMLGDEMDWEEYHAYEDREYTGLDCARWLIRHCVDHKQKLPEIIIHSMNPVGAENIRREISAAKSLYNL